MRSDVPFGALLSGGLDSASVVALMAGTSKYSIETFTIGYDNSAFDETDLAKDVAYKFKTNHHVYNVQPESFDESLKRILFHYDEPFGDASAIPTGIVSRFARNYVKMVLTGDGGDEVLCGYPSFQGMEQLTQQLKSGHMEVMDVPIPALGSGQILVRNHYSLISAGTEGKTVSDARMGLIAKANETYKVVMSKLEAPSPLGYSCAGEVIAVADDVYDFKVGDFVACGGEGAYHADIVSVYKNLCVKIPKTVELKYGAITTIASIAIQGIRQAELTFGETAVVIGLGLIGQLTMQILEASGIKAIGVDISQSQNYLLPNVKLYADMVGVATSRGNTAKGIADKYGFQYSTGEADKIFTDDKINTIFIATRHNLHADSNASFFVDGLWDYSYRHSSGDTLGSNTLNIGEVGFRFRGTLFNSVGFYLRATNGTKGSGDDKAVAFGRATDPRLAASRKFPTEDEEICDWLDKSIVYKISSSQHKKQLVEATYELVLNGIIHGRNELGVSLCGQFYPTKRYFELAIHNGGNSIPELVNNYGITKLSDSKCIEWATYLGHTTKSTPDLPGGLGLHQFSKFIIMNQGAFQFGSRQGYFEKISENEQKHFPLQNRIIDSSAKDFLNNFNPLHLDLGDQLIYHCMFKYGLTKCLLITNDYDFYDFNADIYVLTPNSKILANAKKDNKLI
ncbi:unnamed protein product [Rotaria sp. Silwood1]|nr:unnamed protein product [Rotaria sp. Silwood1]